VLASKWIPYFPDLRNYDEFREPFLGGGSVAIHITKKYPNLDIWVNDLYEPLVNFWQQLQMFGPDLKDKLIETKLKNNTPDKARDPILSLKGFTSMNRFYRILIVLWLSMLSISAVSVVSTEGSSFSEQASQNNFSLRGIRKTAFVF
jgi:DNA adenine methylase